MAPKQSAPPTLVFPPGIVVVVSVEPPEGEPGVVAVVVASVVVVVEVKPQDSGQHACITRMYIGVEGGIEQKYGVAAVWPF